MGDFENTGKAIQKIVKIVTQIDTLSTQNSKSVDNIVVTSEKLDEVTKDLNTQLETFNT